MQVRLFLPPRNSDGTKPDHGKAMCERPGLARSDDIGRHGRTNKCD
jgi:hypothetical protein